MDSESNESGTQPSQDLDHIDTPHRDMSGQNPISASAAEAAELSEDELHNQARLPAENPNPVLRLNAAGRILFANEASRALLQSWGSAAGANAPPDWARVASDALAGGQKRVTEVELGNQVYSFTVVPVTDMGYVNFYGMDITARKRLDQALRQSRDQFAIILQGVADGITAQRADGQLVYANEAAARMIGFASVQELLDTPPRDVLVRFDIFDEAGQPFPLDQLPGRIAIRTGQTTIKTLRFHIRGSGDEYWSVVKAMPIFNERGQAEMAVNIFQDITNLKQVERVQRILADAGATLAASLDCETMLTNVANMAVPHLADWCAVHLVDEDESVHQVAVAHVDPHKLQLLDQLERRYPPDWDAPIGVPNVLRTGKSELYPDIPAAIAEATAHQSREFHLVRQLGLRSAIIVPMTVRGHTLGAIALVWAESGRRYTLDDLAVAEELGRRAALVVDNARLYRQAQRLNTDLERRVEKRTAQLQVTNARLTQEIAERHRAEEQVHRLVAELERRVAERTEQLEDANRGLMGEIAERGRAEAALRVALHRAQELYEVSQRIGMAHSTSDILEALCDTSDLKGINRAILIQFDQPHAQAEQPPRSIRALAEWRDSPTLPAFAVLPEGALTPQALSLYLTPGEPMVIADIHTDHRVNPDTRAALSQLHARSMVVFPLVASAQWYGLALFAFPEPTGLGKEDLRHLRWLVDEAAVATHNILLLEAEATARREAERANALKFKFLAMISHELRTPLQSIKGFASTLLAGDVTWDENSQRDFIETINVEADRLTDLIDQLLDLSLLEAGTLRIKLRACDMDTIMSAAMPQLQAITQNHALRIDAPASLPRMKADCERIAQVITNLVSNAVKYSPVQTAITISARPMDGTVEISVADQGPGISEKDRDQLFHLFQRGDSAERRTRGAGLGLAICKGIVEAHGGRIWLQEGPGTTFSFTLPAADG